MAEDFAAIRPGIALPEIIVEVDREALVRYAGASDDYVRQHWDHAFMIENGYPDVLAHGWLSMAHMCRVVTNWAPRDAEIGGYAVRYHQPLYPGTLRCGAQVERMDGDTAELILWGRNAAGEAIASATLTLVRVS